MKITKTTLCFITFLCPQAIDAFTASHAPRSRMLVKENSKPSALFYKKSEHKHDDHADGAKRKRVYKHLFRHYGDISFDSWLRCEDPESFLLSIGYTADEIQELAQDYEPLLTLNVHDQLAPKVRFLVETLGGGGGRLAWSNKDQDEVSTSFLDEEECTILSQVEIPHSLRLSKMTKENVPASFYGCSLDRQVGPFHAYLEHQGLLHGFDLLEEPARFEEFLQAIKSIETFAALCQEWSEDDEDDKHSIENISDFLDSITEGLLPVSKEEASYFVDLLLEHGYNPLEYDPNTGVGPLHWLAGRGKLAGTQELVHVLEQEHDDPSLLDLMDSTREPKMGATPFHWAASGMTTHAQGCGGSLEVCHWMMDRVFEEGGKDAVKKLCNLQCLTYESTPLMHAAWGGNLKLVQLLVVEGQADPLYADKHGQNALHWAAAAGHLEVCKWLVEARYREALERATAEGEKEALEHGRTLEPDNTGMTPLDYAIQYDRDNVVDWMMKVLS